MKWEQGVTLIAVGVLGEFAVRLVLERVPIPGGQWLLLLPFVVSGIGLWLARPGGIAATWTLAALVTVTLQVAFTFFTWRVERYAIELNAIERATSGLAGLSVVAMLTVLTSGGARWLTVFAGGCGVARSALVTTMLATRHFEWEAEPYFAPLMRGTALVQVMLIFVVCVSLRQASRVNVP